MRPPFDHLAAAYDDTFTRTATGRLQRALVWNWLENNVYPGSTILELNCGTGEDAVWLARRGCRVLATDIAPEMVARAAEKARKVGVEHLIQTRVLDMRELQEVSGEFDLILSNFGGMNCLSPVEIQKLNAHLPRLLRPGGLFVAVVMGRFCGWESFYFMLKGRPREAFRRLGGGPVNARLDGRTEAPTWYYSPVQFRRFFPVLGLKTIQPVGFWLPPSYLDKWFGRRPLFLRALTFLEKQCRGRIWARGADHYMIVLSR